ncbi:hypothetical protein AB0L41_36295 [Amycolatopsis mediterranei]|uniref:hypothetical protein n=1 Tax=Amycolatopsis mediterranei TaxID=33910 RepID=UPI0034219238
MTRYIDGAGLSPQRKWELRQIAADNFLTKTNQLYDVVASRLAEPEDMTEHQALQLYWAELADNLRRVPDEQTWRRPQLPDWVLLNPRDDVATTPADLFKRNVMQVVRELDRDALLGAVDYVSAYATVCLLEHGYFALLNTIAE